MKAPALIYTHVERAVAISASTFQRGPLKAGIVGLYPQVAECGTRPSGPRRWLIVAFAEGALVGTGSSKRQRGAKTSEVGRGTV